MRRASSDVVGANISSGRFGGTSTLGFSDCLRHGENDMRQLTSELPASLLRGVPLHRVLAGRGKCLQSNVGNHHEFMLSVPTDDIDDFISHDWKTPGKDKTIALCYLYNSTIALTGSVGFVLAVTAMKCFVVWFHSLNDLAPLPPIWIASSITLAGPCVYFILLFHWQDLQAAIHRVLSCSARPHLVFLDKICINQQDASSKQRGILGLAAFLKQSRRIVILWSPRYFRRLWCTYELATWVRLSKSVDTVVFWPVAMPKLVVAITCSISLAFIVESLAQLLILLVDGISIRFFEYRQFLLLTMLFIGSVAVTFTLQEVRVQLQSLDEQLLKFSIAESFCFCCSVGHVHPDTQEPLPCDRSLVYRTLARWHSRDGHVDEDEDEELRYMEAFDEGVRTLLRALVLSITPARSLQLGYLEALHLGLPFLWNGLDELFKVLRTPSSYPFPHTLFCVFVESATNAMLVVPAIVLLLCRAMALVPQSDSDPSKTWVHRFMLALFVWGPIMTALVCGLWTPGYVLVQQNRLPRLPIQLVWAVILAATVWSLRRSSRRRPEDFFEQATPSVMPSQVIVWGFVVAVIALNCGPPEF
eukprot:TRINITY_DN60195_c0_g1_i2.p1 TRINITY_DN60195_c0_g1~~TRINITY_DN60195_c0_g1_i2.p1  ORF type:complete len:587 (-),score=11.19 TRINITY_DN60195_c0_g1_i2:178-1938(-)